MIEGDCRTLLREVRYHPIFALLDGAERKDLATLHWSAGSSNDKTDKFLVSRVWEIAAPHFVRFAMTYLNKEKEKGSRMRALFYYM
jgi:hypothetical protein